MVDLFGGVRDEWIASDLSSWLAANRIYKGVADPVREALGRDEVYIVTTKQVRGAAFDAARDTTREHLC